MRGQKLFSLVASLLMCGAASAATITYDTAGTDSVDGGWNAPPIPVIQSAVTLFEEDFDGYTSFPDEHPSNDFNNAGLMQISEGANYDWYGGRFESPNDGTIDQDLAVQEVGGGGNNTPVGRFEDDAGILFKIDTTSLTDVSLTFDWRTFSASSSDRFVAGYYVGSIDFVSDPSDGAFDDRVRNFNDNGPNWDSSWNELVRGVGDSWHDETFSLPSGQSEVWVAFWLDDGEGDFGKVDNILVTALPEPSCLVLLGLGGLGLLRRRGH